jgi:CRP/FNR family transcriptional regulator
MAKPTVVSIGARRAAEMQALATPCDRCEARPHSACAALAPQSQARVNAIMTRVTIAADAPIFAEAEPADHVFTMAAGAVKLYKLLPDGRRQVTGFLFSGDFLGLTHNEAYAYSAEAILPTTLCRFPRLRFEALLEEIPALEHRLLGMAAHELAAAQEQMLLLGRKSARERIVSFLLMLSDVARRRGQPDDPVLLPMSRADIADYLGLTNETISRALTRLKTEGLIRLVDERRIALLRAGDLRRIAGGV